MFRLSPLLPSTYPINNFSFVPSVTFVIIFLDLVSVVCRHLNPSLVVVNEPKFVHVQIVRVNVYSIEFRIFLRISDDQEFPFIKMELNKYVKGNYILILDRIQKMLIKEDLEQDFVEF